MLTLWNKLRLRWKDIFSCPLIVAKFATGGALGARGRFINWFEDKSAADEVAQPTCAASGRNDLEQGNIRTSLPAAQSDHRRLSPSLPRKMNGATEEKSTTFQRAAANLRAAALGGTAVMSSLAQQLTHDTSSVRRTAAEALARVNDPRAIPLLLNALRDDDLTVRVSAIHSLSKVSDKPAVAALLRRLLKDETVGVRLAAAEVLAKQADASLEAPFLGLLEDEHFEVREIAVRFLGKTHNPCHIETLIAMLNDSDNDVREAAALALGEFKTPAAIEGLVLALSDEEGAVRKAAEMALEKTDPNWTHSEAAHRASNQLEMLLLNRPAWVRGAVGHLLAKLQDRQPAVEVAF